MKSQSVPPSVELNSWTRRDVLRSAAATAAVVSTGIWPSLWAEEPKASSGLEAIKEKMPRTAKMIEEAAARAMGQLYVSLNGKVIADVAWGTQANGKPNTPEMLVAWASAVKPTTCVCLMKLWEKGKLDLDDRVVKFIPEFGVNGKEDVRIRHLLTHTGHLGGYTGPINISPRFEDTVKKIVEAPRRAGRGAGGGAPPPVGTAPGYDPAGIWMIAEICRRVDGREFKEIVRKEVYEPCGMLDSWCGVPPERYRAYKAEGKIPDAPRAAQAGAAAGGRFKAAGRAGGISGGGYLLGSEEQAAICQPAGGGVGPTRELARFYEMMLGRGTINGHRIISPQTVEAMTTPKTLSGLMGVWGLGFLLAYGSSQDNSPTTDTPEDAEPKAAEPAAKGASVRRGLATGRLGPHASLRAFGHNGATGMQAFADPEHGLAVAFIGRLRLHSAIYEDLGLAKAKTETK